MVRGGLLQPMATSKSDDDELPAMTSISCSAGTAFLVSCLRQPVGECRAALPGTTRNEIVAGDRTERRPPRSAAHGRSLIKPWAASQETCQSRVDPTGLDDTRYHVTRTCHYSWSLPNRKTNWSQHVDTVHTEISYRSVFPTGLALPVATEWPKK